jgi:hypothetical protein
MARRNRAIAEENQPAWISQRCVAAFHFAAHFLANNALAASRCPSAFNSRARIFISDGRRVNALDALLKQRLRNST